MGDPRNTSSDDGQTGPDASANADASSIAPGMTEAEIRAAGLAIDVPYESGEPKPQRLKYADLGADKKYDASGEQQSEVGAGTHDGPLKGSPQAPSAATGETIPQDATGAQQASTQGTGAAGLGGQEEVT